MAAKKTTATADAVTETTTIVNAAAPHNGAETGPQPASPESGIPAGRSAEAPATPVADAGAPGTSPAAGPDPSEPDLTSYVVRSPIKHNGRRHEIGDTVRMAEAGAEKLIAFGILVKE